MVVEAVVVQEKDLMELVMVMEALVMVQATELDLLVMALEAVAV